MPDPGGGVRQGILAEKGLQVGEFARLLAGLQVAIRDDSHTG
jgi:hypothetical protein